jgi:hypothetical protein
MRCIFFQAVKAMKRMLHLTHTNNDTNTFYGTAILYGTLQSKEIQMQVFNKLLRNRRPACRIQIKRFTNRRRIWNGRL